MAKLKRSPQECSAEVDEVWPRDGQILLRLSLVGATAEKAVLVLKARDGSRAEMRLPADEYGGRFQVRIPLETLAIACTAREWIWDLYLDCRDADTGEEPLRVGRHWDDIPGTHKSFVYPAQRSAGVRVEPYFTVKDNLSIVCTREQAG
ncbi:hypothetical protein ACFCX0_31460 [Streptomyces sp. NPDC056352]|uniref:hypothetical protein n=1 Tax=Streptomyces sp. NPDC056352 TaxID=3345791 RepID=UPI0035D86BAC